MPSSPTTFALRPACFLMKTCDQPVPLKASVAAAPPASGLHQAKAFFPRRPMRRLTPSAPRLRGRSPTAAARRRVKTVVYRSVSPSGRTQMPCVVAGLMPLSRATKRNCSPQLLPPVARATYRTRRLPVQVTPAKSPQAIKGPIMFLCITVGRDLEGVCNYRRLCEVLLWLPRVIGLSEPLHTIGLARACTAHVCRRTFHRTR